MADSTNANLTKEILASMPVSLTFWRTIGGLQIVMASVRFLGNTLVGITLLSNRQLKKNPNNILMANMAIADGIFASWLILTGYWNIKVGVYPYGTLVCRFHMLFTVSSSQISSNILAAMSVVKFIHVGFPFASEKILQPMFIGVLVVICWLPPLVWNGGIFLLDIGMQQFIPLLCYPIYTIFVISMNTICFFLVQFVTVVVATGLVLRIVHRHHRSIGVLTVGIAGAPNTAVTAAGVNSSWKAVRTFVVVVTAFLLMQAPLYFITLTHNICKCLPYELVFEYATYPFNMNCVVNVFIYFIMETRFRKAAIQLLSGGCYGQAEISLSN
ncbi:hypothetical protein LSAT2_026782 [Lamellibrachia satsuma]|nr:hypothetical protein LSAT2_026782 [Lamellibrachia satsuma]